MLFSWTRGVLRYVVHEDPYPTFGQLRDEAPFYRNEQLDFWALSRHSDVAAAFRDAERFSNANGVSVDPSAWGLRFFLHVRGAVRMAGTGTWRR